MRIVDLSDGLDPDAVDRILGADGPDTEAAVRASEIISAVRKGGDKALAAYTAKFDGFALESGKIREIVAGDDDETCDPEWAAADLLAQAEHDEAASVWLICWSESVDAAVFDQVQAQLETLDRDSIARMAIANNGVSFILSGAEDAVDLVDHIAPEHVEILMAEPDAIADRIRNAGAVFIGRYSPTVVGDYFAGRATCFRRRGPHDFLHRSECMTS